MTRRSIEDYAKAIRARYLGSRKAGKRQILDEFCQATGYHRKAAIRLLRRPLRAAQGRPRGRPQRYGPLVVEALRKAWEATNHICSKRLAPFLAELVPILEQHRELALTGEVREAVLGLRPSTIDRLLRPYRRVPKRRPGGHPATVASIRRQIPIRTSGEWKGATPGSVQADLVEHCGESASGFYLYTLTVVDVRSGWTECRPVWGKGMDRVRAGLHRIRQNLPMEVTELHTDNGGEFVNRPLAAYCRDEGIRFTRGRPYRKNDQAYVEQRNWIVRQAVGYERYSTREAYQLMEQLYSYQRLYLNFFQPVRKIVSRERVGAHVRKRYDEAATPYQRLLRAGGVDRHSAKKLAQLYRTLNPAKLQGWIAATQREVWEHRDRVHAYNRSAANAG